MQGKRVLSRATNSIRIYAIYLFLFGAVLMAAPNLLLWGLWWEPTHEPWLRAMGAFMIPVGIYFWRAARSQHLDFFRWSVQSRLLAVALFVFIVAMQWAPPVILAFAAGEGLFAMWTWTDLRADNPKTSPEPQVESLPARRRHDSPSEI